MKNISKIQNESKNSTLTLIEFLSNFNLDNINWSEKNIKISKSTNDFLIDTLEFALAHSLDNFIALYEHLGLNANALEKLLQQDRQSISQSFYDYMAREKTLTPHQAQFFIKHNLIDLKHLLLLQKNNKITTGSDSLDVVLQAHIPKSPRISAFEEFLQQINDNITQNTLLDWDKLQRLSQTIELNRVEKVQQQVNKIKTIRVTKYYGACDYEWDTELYHPQYTYINKNILATVRTKTPEQKNIDIYKKYFVSYLCNNITQDFSKILSVLGLNFTDVLKIATRFNQKRRLEVVKNLVTHLDIKTWLEGDSDSENKNFVQLMTYLRITGATERRSDNVQKGESGNDHKNTREAAYSFIKCFINLQDCGVGTNTLFALLQSLTPSLGQIWKSDKSAYDIFEQIIIPKARTLGSKQFNSRCQSFCCELDKAHLEQNMQFSSTPERSKKFKL